MLIAPFRGDPPSLHPTFDHAAWQDAPTVELARTWRGDPAPPGMDTTARLVWTADALWLGFACRFTELDADTAFDPALERHGLWERDVCEAFVQSPREPSAASYKEIEVAPTGQWFDVAVRTPRVDVDWAWHAGLTTAAAIDHDAKRWTAIVRVPFTAFGGPPTPGAAWRANLFRIGRVDGVRQFLAYAPTGTPAPDFHVPAAFVPLVFTNGPA